MSFPLRFDPIDLPPVSAQLRAEVRTFLREEKIGGIISSWSEAKSGFDREFSKKLGARGWIGMTWPKEYGGHERTAFERYVVCEELLAAGAPLSAHWVADRQSGPLLLKHGTEAHKREILPKITRGEVTFCIGMSEPNSGSDLASVQTSAAKTAGGWLVNGTKLWTTWAHHANYMIALVRTSQRGEDRHEGLSQFLIDLASPGIEIRPIQNMAGNRSFNEVVFTNCFVPDENLLGSEGGGWKQVTSELALERSGPERFLSTFALFVEFVRALGPDPEPPAHETVGRLAAQLITLRNMSISVAGMLQQGKYPNVEAAVVKDLGTEFEQALPDAVRGVLEVEPSRGGDDALARALGQAILSVPAFSIQGGTREILRVIIARGLGLA